MREPLFDIAIPSPVASLSGHYAAEDGSGPKLAIVLQVYSDAGQQKNLAEVCRLLAKESGVRLVAVENAASEIRPQPDAVSVDTLLATSSISAGAMSLLNSGAAPIEVFGVDDMERIERSHADMAHLTGLAGMRESGFKAIRSWLEEIQPGFYAPPVAKLRRAGLKLYGQTASISEQAALIQESASALGVDLMEYPAVARFLEVGSKERQINARRAEQQKAEFVKRIGARLSSWYKSGGRNRIEIDLKKVEALLEYWMETTGQPAAEVEQKLRLGGAEPVFLSMKEWYKDWLLDSATRRADGGAHVFFEELMRFALRAGVPYFDLRDFRESIALQRDLEAIKAGLSDEIADCIRLLTEKSGSGKAARFREIEEALDVLHRALALGVRPEEAETADIRGGALRDLLVETVNLSGIPFPPAVFACIQPLDGGLEKAAEFLTLSRERSGHMVARTLALMAERREDRAILVVGGFHRRAITRALEDDRKVSWSVITPSVQLSAKTRSAGVI
jgi:hypothetical protein